MRLFDTTESDISKFTVQFKLYSEIKLRYDKPGGDDGSRAYHKYTSFNALHSLDNTINSRERLVNY